MAFALVATSRNFTQAARLVTQIYRAHNDTKKIFELAQVVAATSPHRVQKLVDRCFGEQKFQEQFAQNYLPVFPDAEAIARYSEDSLAAHHWRFLQTNKLGELPHPEMKPRERFDYLRLRLYRVHDLWHVLLGLSIAPQDEMALQAFSYGQLGNLLSLILVFTGLAHFLARYPRKFPATAARMWRYYKLGKRVPSLLNVKVEEYLDKPLIEVRKELICQFI